MSNHVNPNMSNREVADFTLVDFKTKQPWLNVDFANVTTTEMAATRVLAKGGRGAAPRVPFDGERTCTMKVDTQITPMKLFAMLAGTEILTSGKVFTRERLTLAAGKLTLSEEPVANSVTVYKADDDCGAAISATVAEKPLPLRMARMAMNTSFTTWPTKSRAFRLSNSRATFSRRPTPLMAKRSTRRRTTSCCR